MILSTSQPYFSPFPGFFLKAFLSDIFVVLDEVQFPRGTTWLTKILYRLTRGRGRKEDIELILDITDNIGGLIDFSRGSFGKTICPFGEAVAWPVRAFVVKFRDEFEACLPVTNGPIQEEVTA